MSSAKQLSHELRFGSDDIFTAPSNGRGTYAPDYFIDGSDDPLSIGYH